jgi:hypothetical protein
MLSLLTFGVKSALATKGAITLVDNACRHIKHTHEEKGVVTWDINVLGKTVKISRDWEYDAFEKLFESARRPFKDGIKDVTGNNTGKYLVLWSLLRYACCADSIKDITDRIYENKPVKQMLKKAVKSLTHEDRENALLVAPIIVLQGAIPHRFPRQKPKRKCLQQ